MMLHYEHKWYCAQECKLRTRILRETWGTWLLNKPLTSTFWDAGTLCGPVEVYECFASMYWLHLQGQEESWASQLQCSVAPALFLTRSANLWTLKIEADHSSESSVWVHLYLLHIPEDGNSSCSRLCEPEISNNTLCDCKFCYPTAALLQINWSLGQFVFNLPQNHEGGGGW
jgi:hypothetical protein